MSDINATMSNLAHQVTFSPQINAEQVKHIAEKGYKTIICNRPNGEELVEEFADFFNEAEQPVYMYCRSGNRSNMIYQASVQLDLLD